MPGTQKKFHIAAGCLKYKSQMPGSQEIYLKSTRLTVNLKYSAVQEGHSEREL